MKKLSKTLKNKHENVAYPFSLKGHTHSDHLYIEPNVTPGRNKIVLTDLTDADVLVWNQATQEWINAQQSGSGGGTWGSITGNLADQTDLQNALDGKVDDAQVLTDVPLGAVFTDTIYTHPAEHAIAEITGLQTALDEKHNIADGHILSLAGNGITPSLIAGDASTGSALNTGASSNILIGINTGPLLTGADGNIALGMNALANLNGDFDFNIAIGNAAGWGNYNSNRGVFIGASAGSGTNSTTSHEYDVVIGNSAYAGDKTYTAGGYNVIIGGRAAAASTGSMRGVVIGYDAAQAGASFYQSVIIGQYAWGGNTVSANSCVIIGDDACEAGFNHTSSFASIFIGRLAGRNAHNLVGKTPSTFDTNYNIGIGYGALQETYGCNGNIAIGAFAGHSAGAAYADAMIQNNIIIGNKAGYYLTNGSQGNILIGSSVDLSGAVFGAGPLTAGAIFNQIFIHNGRTDTPLIWGDMNPGSEKIIINGDFEFTGTGTLPGVELSSNKNVANGYAGLDASGLINSAQLPALAITSTTVVANPAEQLALNAQEGDIAIRSDENQNYIHNGGVTGTLSDWTLLLTPTDTVLSVNGQTGVVSLASTDLIDTANIALLDANPNFSAGISSGGNQVLHSGPGTQTKTGSLTINSNFTPAGPIIAQTITSTDNIGTFNIVDDNNLGRGLYRFDVTSLPAGTLPAGFDYGVLLDIQDSVQPTQLLFGDNPTGRLAVRRRSNSTWDAWSEFIHDQGGQTIDGPLTTIRDGTAGQVWTPNTRTVLTVDSNNAAGTILSIIAPTTGSSGIFIGNTDSEIATQITTNWSTNVFSIYHSGRDAIQIDGLSNVSVWDGVGYSSALHTGGGQVINGTLHTTSSFRSRTALYAGYNVGGVSGYVVIDGAGTGSNEGGELRLHVADDFDTVNEYWRIDAFQDDLRFGWGADNVLTITAEGIIKIPTGTKTLGTGSGNTNFSWVGFYDSTGTTRTGFVGEASSSNQDIFLGSDIGTIKLAPLDGLLAQTKDVDGVYRDILHAGGGVVSIVQPSSLISGNNQAGTNRASATENFYELAQYKAGFWDVDFGATQTWGPGTGWYWGITLAHGSNRGTTGDEYNYGGQIAIRNTGNPADAQIAFRSIQDNTGSPITTGWLDLLHTGGGQTVANTFDVGDVTSLGFTTGHVLSKDITVGSSAATDTIGYKLISLAGGKNIRAGMFLDTTGVAPFEYGFNYTYTTDGATDFVIYAIDNERFRITSAGEVSISTGNLAFSAGNGIDFSAATPDASGVTAEILNDYEEGTWTPTGANISTASGTYTKIGDTVYCSASITMGAGGSSGSTIGGLPFTVSSTAGTRGGGVVSYQNTDSVTWQLLTNHNSTQVVMYTGSTGKTMAASSIAYFEFWYKVA